MLGVSVAFMIFFSLFAIRSAVLKEGLGKFIVYALLAAIPISILAEIMLINYK